MKRFLIILSILQLFNFHVSAETNIPPLPSQNSLSNATESSIEQAKKQVPPKPYDKPHLGIRIGVSSSENDLHLPLGSTICIFLNNTNSKNCRVVQYKSSFEAINSMLNGDVNIVLTDSVTSKFFLDKSNKIETKKIRFVSSLFDEKLVFITRKDLNIKQLSSLKGTSINISQKDSLNRIIFDDLIAYMKWQISDFKTVSEFTNDEAIKGICKGIVDATLIVAEDMNKDLKDVTRLCELNIINLSQDEINTMTQNPAYIPTKIDGGTYVGMPNDINTAAGRAILLSTSQVSNEQIYFLISEISRHLKEIRLLHYSLNNLSMEDCLNLTRIAPLHDGVLEFMEKSNLKEKN